MNFLRENVLSKARSHPRTLLERSWSGEKKSSLLVTVYHRLTKFGLRQNNAVYTRPPLMFPEGLSYRSESIELHKILRAVRRWQFSAPAKFTPAPPTPIQSLAPLDASSWTLGCARPTQKS